ncbi:hypothetical protein M8J77_024428 [Diaphorina citri]|nr:hypothetical protein M8J77_024428 [Diaphorina citri]
MSATRFVFNTIKQEDDEDYTTYFLRLSDQLKLCEYKNMEEEIMIDKIICSIQNVKMKEKLWMKEKLKLAEVVQLCKADEESRKQIENVSGKLNDVNKISSSSKYRSDVMNKQQKRSVPGNKKCVYCGGLWHTSLQKCPARNKTSFKCNKRGHFSQVCLGEAEVKQLTEGSESETEVLKIEKLGTSGVFSHLNFVLPRSKVKSLKCQLDTGANCNVIGYKQLKDILGQDPRFLNQAIKDTKQPLPTLDEVLPELKNAKLFSRVDATVDEYVPKIISTNRCSIKLLV